MKNFQEVLRSSLHISDDPFLPVGAVAVLGDRRLLDDTQEFAESRSNERI